MNILLVSQCSGRALPESRRILDQFAERRGERTWQTPITMQGLDTLRKLLRKSARRNTAVACHWIRGRNHSELVWIVGNAQRFNSEGAVPTNTTSRDVLRITDENDWHTANIIQLLACLAGLFHDLGKAWTRFQQKLTDKDHQKNSKEKRHKKDLLRHEWVSLRLFLAFVGGDDDEGWLNRLVNLKAEKVPAWLAEMQSDGSKAFASSAPLKNLPALAQTVAWLLVSHHFLPQCPRDDASRFLQPEALEKILRHISPTWNRAKAEFDRDKERDLLTKPREFSKGTPFASTHWCRRVSTVAEEMLSNFSTLQEEHWLDNPYVIHLSRLCLMLSDHYYSSLKKFGATSADPDFALWANTRDKELNQRLDDHLLGVGKGARRIARSLPELARQLPVIV
ncbi:MAG TPA: type I-F CRISPR-associated helicase Cas3, partial [Porticoccaceae bacterium]|nr:type I-F CRISPR-associated helicase Cas3 [Porticoccaceae bacterium]